VKRKPSPQKADRENPAWTKETFARARTARDVLPDILGDPPLFSHIFVKHSSTGGDGMNI
jgi:hypothetical protein